MLVWRGFISIRRHILECSWSTKLCTHCIILYTNVNSERWRCAKALSCAICDRKVGEVKEVLCSSMSIWIFLMSVEMLQIYILPLPNKIGNIKIKHFRDNGMKSVTLLSIGVFHVISYCALAGDRERLIVSSHIV